MTNPSSMIGRGNVRSENLIGSFAELLARRAFRGVFNVRSSIFIIQDALRASSTSNRRRARTRLANPKSENNCAVFFANPR